MIVNNKTGIVLSGGGFRGIAHLGVLQYLKECEVPIDAIAGASAGALVGAMIAQGYEPLEILKFAKEEKFFSYSQISARNGGIFNPSIIEKLVKKYIPHDSFEALKCPLYVSVSDLTHAKSLIFNEGCLSFAVKASCSFPLIFQPVYYKDDIYLCDGGLLDNFPTEQIVATCNKIIGVNVNPINITQIKLSYKEIIKRIIRIATSNIKETAKQKCTLYLQPDSINDYNTFNASKIDDIYKLGYNYAAQYEAEIRAIKI